MIESAVSAGVAQMIASQIGRVRVVAPLHQQDRPAGLRQRPSRHPAASTRTHHHGVVARGHLVTPDDRAAVRHPDVLHRPATGWCWTPAQHPPGDGIVVAAVAGVGVEPGVDQLGEPNEVGVVDQTVQDGCAGVDIQAGEPPVGPSIEQVQHRDQPVSPIRALTPGDQAPESQSTGLRCRREVVGRHNGVDRGPQSLGLRLERVHQIHPFSRIVPYRGELVEVQHLDQKTGLTHFSDASHMLLLRV
jgi:hypothetical protein